MNPLFAPKPPPPGVPFGPGFGEQPPRGWGPRTDQAWPAAPPTAHAGMERRLAPRRRNFPGYWPPAFDPSRGGWPAGTVRAACSRGGFRTALARRFGSVMR